MTAPSSTAVQKAPVDPAIGAAIDVYRRLDTIRNVLAPDLNDQELQLFAIVAERSRLDPFAKQIYAIKRGGRVTFQTGIDGFRSSAEETDEYRGSDEPDYGPMIEAPFPHPEWAKVIVHRQFGNGEWLHQPATAYFNEMYPGDPLGAQWRKMPRVMLAKCAEAAAFRKAFPKRFSDVYTAEEMAQADAADLATPVGPTARERLADRRAQVEAQSNGGGPTATGATDEPNPAPPPNPAAECESRSPKNEACVLPTGHTGDHRRANKSWPASPQQAASLAGQSDAAPERAPAGDSEARSDEGAAATPAAAPDVTAEAADIFEGDFVDAPDAEVQAGLDLIPASHQKEGS